MMNHSPEKTVNYNRNGSGLSLFKNKKLEFKVEILTLVALMEDSLKILILIGVDMNQVFYFFYCKNILISNKRQYEGTSRS